MKIIVTTILVFILITVSNLLFAQNQTIDSLKKVLQTQKEDSTRVKLLFNLGAAMNTQYEKSIQYIKEAIALAHKLNWNVGTSYEAKALGLLSLREIQQARYDTSAISALKMLDVSEKINDSVQMTQAYLYLGESYRGLNLDSLSEKQFKEYLFIATTIKNDTLTADANVLLANLAGQQKNWNEEEKYLKEAMNIFRTMGIRDTTLRILLLIAERQEELHEFPQALNSYRKVISSYERENNYRNVAYFKVRMSIVFGFTNNKDSAYYYANAALQLSKDYKLKKELGDSYLQLYVLSNQSGNYKNALRYYQLFDSLRDDLVGARVAQNVENARMKYETDKRELAFKAEQDKKDALTNAEISRQKVVRNFSMAGAAGVLFLGGFIFYNFRKRKKLESEQALSSERLRISRELHDDIGSTLGSIAVYSDVAKNRSVKNENQTEVLSKIGTASRELIEKMSDIVWSLNPDNETFEQLQNRMQGFANMILTPRNIVVEFKADDELKTLQLTSEQRKNIFLIYKEAVHNIIKYAECKNVWIALTKSNNTLSLVIKDDGKGFDSDNPVAYNGNGLKNMKARADDMKASIFIRSGKDAGTSVELTVAV